MNTSEYYIDDRLIMEGIFDRIKNMSEAEFEEYLKTLKDK